MFIFSLFDDEVLLCAPSYSHDGYSVWYYGDNQIPSTISDELDVVIAENLTKRPGANVVGELGTPTTRGCCYKQCCRRWSLRSPQRPPAHPEPPSHQITFGTGPDEGSWKDNNRGIQEGLIAHTH